MDISVIKSYLVELGFKVDNRQVGIFNESLKKAANIAGEATGKITKGFLLAGATIGGVLTSIGVGTIGLMSHVADADLDMQVLARRLYLSTDAARKMKTATDALGYSIEEIVWGPPELAERYRQLIHDQNKMISALGGADFEKQMRNLRDVRFEFTRLSVEMKYFSMLVVADLSKALFGDENSLLQRLRQFSDWFLNNMPRVAQEIATKVAPSFHKMGDAAAHLWESLSKVDWGTLLNDLVKITTTLIKVLDFIVSHPTVMKMLLGAGGGAAIGSLFGPAGTAIGGLIGGTVGAADAGLDAIVKMRHKAAPNFYESLGVHNFNGPSLLTPIQKQIAAAAIAAGVDPSLALAVARQESNFNPNAINRSSGAMGLFQLMPGTASQMGVKNAYDPSQNIRAGIQLLRDLIARHGGDVSGALKDFGGFVSKDPSGYIASVERYRRQYQSSSPKPISMQTTVNVGGITITQPNATPEQIHKVVSQAVGEKLDQQNQILLTQRQGVFA